MSSFLSWLDYDAAARERAMRILSLFNVSESRDELGIGAIRDTIADRLFPGTSTIQTRLRYMLIVPWTYRLLEEQRVPAAKFAVRADQDERLLIKVLLATDEKRVFGREAGVKLKRLPSSVYWAGLGAWGIRRFSGSQSDYYRQIDQLYLSQGRRRKKEDEDSDPDPESNAWHPRLPTVPEGFPAQLDLQVTPDEASFLADRIGNSCKGSLLDWLVKHGKPDDCAEPWLHMQFANFPEPMRHLLQHARLFCDIVEGAARLYNVSLADLQIEQSKPTGNTFAEARRDEHESALEEWRERVDWAALKAWSLDDFWSETVERGHDITPGVRAFITAWLARLLDTEGLVRDDREARNLVRSREMKLKGSSSRFTNKEALGQWGGNSGTGRNNFRWGVARDFLVDLYPALGRS